MCEPLAEPHRGRADPARQDAQRRLISGSRTATVASTLASGSPSDSTRQLACTTARPTRSTLGHASTHAPGVDVAEIRDVQVGGRDRGPSGTWSQAARLTAMSASVASSPPWTRPARLR